VAKRVLIVEDEESILVLIFEILRDLRDCRILCARNGEEAIRISRENHFDLILLDFRLPGKNGSEVCRLVKSDPALSQTKVLMLSAVPQDSYRQIAWQAGADAFVNKPFNNDNLLEKVEELLGKQVTA
jgi:CheY-like chemotaxis protein